MATSMTFDANGFRVLTHIIPLTSPELLQCPTESKNTKVQSEAAYMTRMFLKGEPVALGTVQLFIGMVMIILGTVILLTQTLDGRIPLGLGLLFVVCGSVTLGARKGNVPALIKSTLVLNIISVLMALSGIGYFCYVLSFPPAMNDCGERRDPYSYYDFYSGCQGLSWKLQAMIVWIKVMLLVLSVFEVCVCTTLVIFSCKARRQATVTNLGEMAQGAENYSHEALLNGNEDLGHPPPYEA